jgi:hypothetical protein
LTESCQGDRKQEQQSVLKPDKSTVEVHSVWHDIYVATKTGGQMPAVVYYSVRLRKSVRERARDLRTMHKYYNNIFSANKQNSDAQACERGGHAVFKLPLKQKHTC